MTRRRWAGALVLGLLLAVLHQLLASGIFASDEACRAIYGTYYRWPWTRDALTPYVEICEGTTQDMKRRP